MSEHYNQNYTREEVEVILNKIQSCINDDQYIISQNENRKENTEFINEYRINKKVITVSFHKRNKPIDYLFR